MATDDQAQTAALRRQLVDGMVTGFASDSFKFKQAVSIVKTSAWSNVFFREDPTVLTASGNTVQALAGRAEFWLTTFARGLNSTSWRPHYSIDPFS